MSNRQLGRETVGAPRADRTSALNEKNQRPRGRREAVAGGWTTGEAAAYPGPDGGRRLRRAGGWRRAKTPQRQATARSTQQRDARVGQIGEGEPAIEVEAHCLIPNTPYFFTEI
jgi:hypothetical protein